MLKLVSDLEVCVDNISSAVSILAPEEANRKKIIVEGDNDEAIGIFYDYVRKLL